MDSGNRRRRDMVPRVRTVSEERRERVLVLRERGYSWRRVAELEGCSMDAARRAAGIPRKIAPTNPDAKMRRCLKCRVEYLSEWAGDRYCPPCRTAAQRAGEPYGFRSAFLPC